MWIVAKLAPGAAPAQWALLDGGPAPIIRPLFDFGAHAMLQALRNTAGTWVLRIFLFLLVISFGIWGIADIFRGGGDPALAKVGQVEISLSQFQQEYRRSLQRLQAAMGGQLDADRARALGLPDQTLQTMVGRALLDQKVALLGLAIDDATVRADIVANPAFRGNRGEFDRLVFENRLRAAGMTEQGFVTDTRRDMTRDMLLGALAGGAAAPKVLAEALYRFRQERRVAEIAIVAQSAMPEPQDPSEEALAAFHRERAERFSAPEYRAVSLVRFTPADFAPEIAVGEDDIKDEYEARASEFQTAEQREVDMLLFDDEAQAKTAKARLTAGEDFMAVGKAMLDRKPEDIALGMVAKADLPEEFADHAFDLGANAVGEPLKTPFGWHLFRVRAIIPAQTQTLEDARGRLLTDIRLRRAADTLANHANKLEDALAGGAKLEDAAAKVGLTVTAVAAVDAEGQDPAGKPIDGLSEERNLIDAIFVTGDGDETRLMETSKDGYAIARVTGIRPSALKPLAEVRSEVLAAWRGEQRAAAANAVGEKLIEQVKAGESFSGAARTLKLETKISAQLRRSGPSGDQAVSGALAAKLFELKPGEMTLGATVAGDGTVVARLAEIVPADPAADEAGVERIARALTEAVGADLLNQYQQALQGQFKVTINDRVRERAF
ncbi:MAG: hypothetical protein FJX46_02415 [Alphaproteobacteria bacterium]|nr:hypothetical protein [Alphaproteobacteria bacterium]